MGRRFVLLAEACGTLSLVGAFVLALASCSSGGGGGGSGGPVALLGCTLGCSGGNGCAVSQIAPNQPITLYFSHAIDPASVDDGTFQVIRMPEGTSAAGSYTTKPDGSVTFTPEVGFDQQTGIPQFGLATNASYTVNVPAAGEAFFTMRSTDGAAISQGIHCAFSAVGDPVDSVAGPPKVSFVTPGTVANADPATPIVLEFNDIMNLATLFDPASQKSATILVEVSLDSDSNPSTPPEKVSVPGQFSASFPTLTSTRLVFVPSVTLGGESGKVITVSVLASISDLVGNPLLNPGSFQFTVAPLPQATLEGTISEEFASSAKEDFGRTGALWNRNGSGKLQPGSNASLGLLEDLVIPSGTTMNLDTAAVCAAFPETKPNGSPSGYGTPSPGCALRIPINDDGQEISLYSALFSGNSLSGVTFQNGILSVGSLRIESSATLKVRGNNPLRLLVRGRGEIQGFLDLDGEKGADQPTAPSDQTIDVGGVGANGGPAAGKGGDGGDDPLVPGGNPNGRSGEGRGGAVAGTNGGGQGSPCFPLNGQNSSLTWLSVSPFCLASEASSGPGGGGDATPGAAGLNATKGGTVKGPPGTGGSAYSGNPFSDPFAANFLGGGGGGGGGATPWKSKTVPTLICTGLQIFCPNPNCVNGSAPDLSGCLTSCFVSLGVPQGAACCKGPATFDWTAGSGGGAGGGAGLVQTGRDLIVSGFVTARGGLGGDGPYDVNPFDGTKTPTGGTAGGGGSGGLIALRGAQGVKVIPAGAVVSLSAKGGAGGLGTGSGGAGGNGAVRVEVDTSLTALPSASEFTGLSDPAVSIAAMGQPVNCPVITGIGLPAGGVCLYSMSAAQSQFYALKAKYLEPEILRCELDLDLSSGPKTIVLPQAPSDALGSAGWKADPISHLTPGGILFQGAEDDGKGNPKNGTLSPWVWDIRQLNGGNPTVPKRKNLIRFLFVFDRSYAGPDAAQALRGLRFAVKGK